MAWIALSIPLMILAIVVAVAPVLVATLRHDGWEAMEYAPASSSGELAEIRRTVFGPEPSTVTAPDLERQAA